VEIREKNTSVPRGQCALAEISWRAAGAGGDTLGTVCGTPALAADVQGDSDEDSAERASRN
jgi:hypothetical protein